MKVLRSDVTGETELIGSARELSRLAAAVRDNDKLVPLNTEGDPSPYDRMLETIKIEAVPGKVTISTTIDPGVLEIRGGAEELRILASNIEAVAQADRDHYHLHVEFYPGHPYLSESSEPLVIANLGRLLPL